MLPYASALPGDFIQKIIGLLNRGSISTVDPSDVFGTILLRFEITLC